MTTGSHPLVPHLDGFEAHYVPAFRANKPYVCPECGNEIGVGVTHTVAWPLDYVDDRRHWHLHCWRLAARRGRTR